MVTFAQEFNMNQQLKIKTPDGIADANLFYPDDPGSWPAIILYMDAFGPRPELFQMADRLASNGYSVLLPDLYYRMGPREPFNIATAFVPGPERDRMGKFYSSLSNELVMRDTAAFLDFLSKQSTVAGKKVGCVGYCMGGQFALSAAGTFPDRIAAAASFHGARLATDQPDSPHLLAPKMRGKIYVGIAGIDPHFTDGEKNRLENALKSAGVDYAVEIYPNVKHGFAVNGTPAYDREGSERHWQELLQLFSETLQSGSVT
jgi:carboxymethylenebutenolidase